MPTTSCRGCRRPAWLHEARPRHPDRHERLSSLINATLWLISSSVDVIFNDTSHQNTSAWMDGRFGGLKEEKGRTDISPAKHHTKPSTAPSHPIRSIPAQPPLCRPYLNNNCCSDATPAAMMPFPQSTRPAWFGSIWYPVTLSAKV